MYARPRSSRRAHPLRALPAAPLSPQSPQSGAPSLVAGSNLTFKAYDDLYSYQFSVFRTDKNGTVRGATGTTTGVQRAACVTFDSYVCMTQRHGDTVRGGHSPRRAVLGPRVARARRAVARTHVLESILRVKHVASRACRKPIYQPTLSINPQMYFDVNKSGGATQWFTVERLDGVASLAGDNVRLTRPHTRHHTRHRTCHTSPPCAPLSHAAQLRVR